MKNYKVTYIKIYLNMFYLPFFFLKMLNEFYRKGRPEAYESSQLLLVDLAVSFFQL